MGVFSRKSKGSTSSHTASSIADGHSLASSQSSLKSPANSSFSRMSNPMGGASPVSKIPLPKAPDPHVDPAGYLKSIVAVRERSFIVLDKAKRNQLRHFDVDMHKFQDTTKFVVSIIKRDFAPEYASIPPHGRWQHFNVGGKDRMGSLINSWTSADPSEKCRRLIDLFIVSVLLDAGAGTEWSYKSKENGRVYKRSEGLAIASYEMFKAGLFSSSPTQPHQVDEGGLKQLTVEQLAAGLQVSDQNPIAGLEGRAGLLVRLGDAMENATFFGDMGRPGAMLDYLISHPTTSVSSVPIVTLPTLWTVLVDGLAPIWPSSRTQIDGTSIGDAWPLRSLTLEPNLEPWETIVPFHKLTQWLCYSLMQPMTNMMKIQFAGAHLMTGLPEYRNGGLFIDTGVLTLKKDDEKRGLEQFHQNAQSQGKKSVEVVPMFSPDDDVVVEWRAITVGFLDLLLTEVNLMLGLSGQDVLTLPQMLEAGSWKGGREMAEISRPNTQCPPIAILSDGTVF